MEIRTYKASIKMECCRDGAVINSPPPLLKHGEDRKKVVTESFDEWKERVRFNLEKKYKPEAKEECLKLGTSILCKFDIKLDFMEGRSVTGAVYRILRMAARGRVHIYGLSDKEFYDRMSKTREKYNKKQSDELLKLFKQGLITTAAKV